MKAMESASGKQSVVTLLATDQVREAEAAFHRLQANPRSLTFYLDYALANYREPVTQNSSRRRSRPTSPPNSTSTNRTCFPSRTSRA